jgi:hypothetical protein
MEVRFRNPSYDILFKNSTSGLWQDRSEALVVTLLTANSCEFIIHLQNLTYL